MIRYRSVLTNFSHSYGKWLGALLLAGFFQVALAQNNSIESISTTQQGANLIVRIALKAPPANPPVGFSIANPARVALDFLKTANNSGQATYEANQADLRSINVVQAGDRTRMVLNLKRMVNYSTVVDGSNVLITLAPQITDGTANTTAATTHFAAPVAGAGGHSIKDIDFQRGPDGEGRIIIDLSDNQTGIDIRTQGQNIVVDFLKASLPENLRRRLNVTDFATPVQNINTFTQGENIRMVIEPKGLWEHNAYQTDNRLVVEVKAVKEDPTKLFSSQKVGYKGERLSLNFQNVEVRSLLQVIADFTNLNIITSDSVGGNLTLRLKDVPWDQALDIIMQSKGLDMRKNGNVLLIAPKDELNTKEKLDLEAQAAIADLEPTRSESFQLNYTKAESFKDVLTEEGGASTKRILSKRGRAVIDARTNQLFVTDIPSKLEELRQLINKIDVPSRQVLIEARIVEADDQFSRNLGTKFGISTGPQRGMVTGGTVGIGADSSGSATTTQTAITYPLPGPAAELTANQNAFSLPAGGLNGFNAGNIALTYFAASFSRFITLELSALEADGKGKIVSSPRVITADQVKALIEQGTEIPYQVATSSGATSIQFRKANLKLEVTPQITPEGNIILDVDVNKDSVNTSINAGAGLAIDTKHVQTKVLVENGGTVVLGGIYISNESTSVTKVPLLGDIPVMGNLFKNTAKVNNKTELLIFITPKVISDRVNVK